MTADGRKLELIKDGFQIEKAQSEDQVESLIHGTFWPIDIRTTQNIKCRISFDSNHIDAVLWRLSPLGGEFLVSESDKALLDAKQEFDLSVDFNGSLCRFKALTVCSKVVEDKGTVFGARWVSEIRNRTQTKRSSRRWTCSTAFLPTGMAANPHNFHDLILFRLIDFSDAGMQLKTSLRNKFIIPGMKFSGTFTFPIIGSAEVKFQVRNTNIDSEGKVDYLRLGVELVDPSRELLLTLGQYAAQFGDYESIDDLKESGLMVKNFSIFSEVGYCRTKEEFEEVLDLRKRAYESRIQDPSKRIGVKAEEFTDIYDTRARILIIKHKGKIVASMRLIFNDNGQAMEQEGYVTLPKDFPDISDIIEVSRACIDPAYRSSDLFIRMLKQALYISIETRRDWFIIAAPTDLISLYRRCGYKPTKLKYTVQEVAGAENVELTLMMFNMKRGIRGETVNPLIWGFWGKELLQFAKENGMIRLRPTERFRLSIYSFIYGVVSFMLRRRGIRKK